MGLAVISWRLAPGIFFISLNIAVGIVACIFRVCRSLKGMLGLRALIPGMCYFFRYLFIVELQRLCNVSVLYDSPGEEEGIHIVVKWETAVTQVILHASSDSGSAFAFVIGRRE